jgi:putative hydrolase of the HAD superfamily
MDAAELSTVLARDARELWFTAPLHEWCMAIGISSWEGLSGDLSGDGAELKELREWMDRSRYRVSAWRRALGRFGVDDEPLARKLAEDVVRLRKQHHALYPETRDVLETLRGDYQLALLTNGAPQIQRQKLASLDLEKYFEAVVVSGEVGVGKPEAGVFREVLDSLAVAPGEAVMIGDNLVKDVGGAKAVGMRGIWVNRSRKAREGDVDPDAEIADLRELLQPGVLDA